MEKRRTLHKRKKITASASFLDPVLRNHIKPSLERQVRFKLRDYCFGGGKSRGNFQSWLDISNGYIQALPEVKKVIRPVRSSSGLSRMGLSRMGQSKAGFSKASLRVENEKPMFILIGEREVNRS